MSEDTKSATFFGVVKPYRMRISITYSVMLFENIFELLYPFAIGLAINGLIAGEGIVSLSLFAAIWGLQLITATARQLYDTRLFAMIYSEVASSMILRQRDAGKATSEIAARSVMAREAVDFFEFEIPALVTALITLVGGVAMLFVYNVLAGAAMLLILLPVGLIYRKYGKRSFALTQRLNNRHEREVGAIEDGAYFRVKKHFAALARWRIMLSDAQAIAWTIADFIIFGAVMAVLLVVTQEPGIKAGDVFAAMAYVLTIVAALDEAPLLVEQFSRLVDIRRRVDETEEVTG